MVNWRAPVIALEMIRLQTEVRKSFDYGVIVLARLRV